MEAQRFPMDYDGIIAGAPANYWTRLLTAGMVMQAMTLSGDGYIPAAKLPAINAAVLSACDSKDGVTDGLLNDPRQCQFDPAVLICKGADADSCLTESQARALKSIYAGSGTPAEICTFRAIRLVRKNPAGTHGLRVRRAAAPVFLRLSILTNMVYEKADWDFKTSQLR